MGTPAKVHRNAEIVKAMEAGASIKVLMGGHGISRARIYQICKRAGAKLRNPPLSPEETAYIEAQYATKVPVGQIQLVGRGRDRARNYLIRAGLRQPHTDITPWRETEDLALVTRYYTDGPRAVGKDLGRSKNEVIGRAHRLRKKGLLICPWEKPLY